MSAESIGLENLNIAHKEEYTQALKNTAQSHSLMPVSKDALSPAPFDGLVEFSKFGSLPIIGKNNLAPFDAYKKPFNYDVKKPLIAIAVRGADMTPDPDVFSKLVPQVSILLSPYSDLVDTVQKQARNQGYEVWLELPVESNSYPYDDPGPKGILVRSGLQYNQDNYRSVLASTTGYAGLAVYTDSAFQDAKPMINGILMDAFKRGLGFFEMNHKKDSIGPKIAINNKAPFLKASMKIEDQTLAQSFKALKKKASSNRLSVAVLDVTPAMLANFQREVLEARKEGFEIVPLSAVADQL